MSAAFVAASNQYINNAATPITAAPLTVSFWFNMPTSGDYQILWGISDTAASGNDWYVAKETGNTISFNGDQGASFFIANTATAITSNAWTFVVCREIAANNHRIAILHANGVMEHANSTTSITPSSLDAEQIGGLLSPTIVNPMDGSVAELSLWNADIQADGAQLLNSTLRQLAFGGPFSLPHMSSKLIEYRSFRSGLGSDQDRIGEVYSGGAGRQIWTNTNGATLGPHPPLPYWYAKPAQAPRALVV